MTVFSQIFDAFRTVCQTEIGTNLEIPDPYELERNAPSQLEKGWGLTIGASTPFIDQFNTSGEEITFGLVLTATTLGHQMDGARIANAVKVLKDMDVATRTKLVQPGYWNTNQVNVIYSGATGVDFIDGNLTDFNPQGLPGTLTNQDIVATTTINYTVRIFEALT